jgi:hypothetical protein
VFLEVLTLAPKNALNVGNAGGNRMWQLSLRVKNAFYIEQHFSFSDEKKNMLS